MTATYNIINADVFDGLAQLEDGSVHTCVTSPPYWGLRDYGHDGQLGLEQTPDEYVARMVEVFCAVRRVLRDDGTLWLNLGDSYYGSWGAQSRSADDPLAVREGGNGRRVTNGPHETLKPKDLVGIPWRVAFALQADGWYLRQDIIWHKPNPMPESVRDRCTKAHEYIFLLSKSARYYFDAEAIAEPFAAPKTFGVRDPGNGDRQDNGRSREDFYRRGSRNRRSVWTVTTKPYKGAHFATFPPDLIEPCILAGAPLECCAECGAPVRRVVERRLRDDAKEIASRRTPNAQRPSANHGHEFGRLSGVELSRLTERVDKGTEPTCTCDAGTQPGTVLDPFTGSGTTAAVALKHGRNFVGTELNPEYVTLAEERIAKSLNLWAAPA